MGFRGLGFRAWDSGLRASGCQHQSMAMKRVMDMRMGYGLHQVKND